jgi:hypothetical protein
MKVSYWGICILGLLSASAGCAEETPHKHAYYLFETASEHQGCSGCYIPLLVTRTPLTNAVANEAVVIVTYERDSIWELKSKPAIIGKEDVQPDVRSIRFEGKEYRYQEVDRSEAVQLLKDPMGHIPISRLKEPIGEPEKALSQELLRDLTSTAKK